MSKHEANFVSLVMAATTDPSLLVEIKVPDQAAHLPGQIDPAFLHARDGAVIGGAACQPLTHASTLDQEGGAKVLLKHRLHHRAAAEVANTDTENLFHHPTITRGSIPATSEMGRRRS